MKKSIRFAITGILFLAILSFSCINNAKEEAAFPLEKFEIEKLHFYEPTENLKIVAFMPSTYVDCDYASMLTKSLNLYFVQGLAFTPEQAPKIDVVLVVNDADKWNATTDDSEQPMNNNLLDGISTYYDEKGEIYGSLGINTFATTARELDSLVAFNVFLTDSVRDESARLYLLDEQNHILLEDTNYRAQGEHLKPLENAIKKHLEIENFVSTDNTSIQLKVGDKAPDIMSYVPDSSSDWSLSLTDEKYNIVNDTSTFKVITFYPAAFSGVIPSFGENHIDYRLMTCFIHIPSFDYYYEGKNIRTFAISNSTNTLLFLWKSQLDTEHIIYVNDEDCSISKNYNAFNSEGYNNRMTYIIDEEGIIQYIDSDYAIDDRMTIQLKLEEIINNK
ncbi:MAG: hypothetical protein ACPG4Z_06100 [Chitinophagales bacterium]